MSSASGEVNDDASALHGVVITDASDSGYSSRSRSQKSRSSRKSSVNARFDRMTTSMSSVASGEEGGKSVGIQRRKILPTKEGVRGSVLGRGKRGGGLGSSDSEEDRSERKRKRRRSGGGLGGPGGTAGSLGERFGMLRAGSRTGSGSRALGEGVEDELKGRGVLARTPRGDDDPDDAPYLELKQEFSPSGSGRRRTVVCDRRLPVDSRPRRRASLESPIGMPPWMQKDPPPPRTFSPPPPWLATHLASPRSPVPLLQPSHNSQFASPFQLEPRPLYDQQQLQHAAPIPTNPAYSQPPPFSTSGRLPSGAVLEHRDVNRSIYAAQLSQAVPTGISSQWSQANEWEIESISEAAQREQFDERELHQYPPALPTTNFDTSSSMQALDERCPGHPSFAPRPFDPHPFGSRPPHASPPDLLDFSLRRSTSALLSDAGWTGPHHPAQAYRHPELSSDSHDKPLPQLRHDSHHPLSDAYYAQILNEEPQSEVVAGSLDSPPPSDSDAFANFWKASRPAAQPTFPQLSNRDRYAIGLLREAAAPPSTALFPPRTPRTLLVEQRKGERADGSIRPLAAPLSPAIRHFPLFDDDDDDDNDDGSDLIPDVNPRLSSPLPSPFGTAVNAVSASNLATATHIPLPQTPPNPSPRPPPLPLAAPRPPAQHPTLRSHSAPPQLQLDPPSPPEQFILIDDAASDADDAEVKNGDSIFPPGRQCGLTVSLGTAGAAEGGEGDEGWRFDWDAVLPGVEEEVEVTGAVKTEQRAVEEQEQEQEGFEIYEDPIEEC